MIRPHLPRVDWTRPEPNPRADGVSLERILIAIRQIGRPATVGEIARHLGEPELSVAARVAQTSRLSLVPACDAESHWRYEPAENLRRWWPEWGDAVEAPRADMRRKMQRINKALREDPHAA
jgi:hypothetical protein